MNLYLHIYKYEFIPPHIPIPVECSQLTLSKVTNILVGRNIDWIYAEMTKRAKAIIT